MIRKATSKDIPALQDLLHQVLNVHHEARPDLFKANASKYTNAQLEEILADSERPVFVLENEQGKIDGYAFGIFIQHLNDNILTDIKTLYIDDICVNETCRGKHVGAQLYDFMKQYARENGCYNLTLNVWYDNESARKFYERMGLHPQKIGMEVLLEEPEAEDYVSPGVS